MLNDAFQRETRRFDVEHALPAWDALIAKQQSSLAALGVPAMKGAGEVCRVPLVQGRPLTQEQIQRKVMRVLDGLV